MADRACSRNRFRHQEAAEEYPCLLNRLRIDACKALGISAGGNVLLHMSTQTTEARESHGAGERDVSIFRHKRDQSCASMRTV